MKNFVLHVDIFCSVSEVSLPSWLVSAMFPCASSKPHPLLMMSYSGQSQSQRDQGDSVLTSHIIPVYIHNKTKNNCCLNVKIGCKTYIWITQEDRLNMSGKTSTIWQLCKVTAHILLIHYHNMGSMSMVHVLWCIVFMRSKLNLWHLEQNYLWWLKLGWNDILLHLLLDVIIF